MIRSFTTSNLSTLARFYTLPKLLSLNSSSKLNRSASKFLDDSFLAACSTLLIRGNYTIVRDMGGVIIIFFLDCLENGQEAWLDRCMVNETSQVISIYLDDSGVFSLANSLKYFVYAGYSFVTDRDRLVAKSVYKKRVDEIKARKGIERDTELKAAGLHNRHKNALFDVVKQYNSVDCIVDLTRVYPSIMSNKLAIHRYKDYVLKRLIKFEVERLIDAGEVDPYSPAALKVYIDQQHTSTNGYYTLAQSVTEELNHGIHNFDYAVFHSPIFKAPVTVSIQFCDSSHNYLVQASDILANRVFTAYNYEKQELIRDIPHHSHIELP